MKKSGGPGDVKKGAQQVKAGARTIAKGAVKNLGSAAKKVDDQLEKRYPNYTGKGTAYSDVKKVVKSAIGYSKGGSTRKIKSKK